MLGLRFTAFVFSDAGNDDLTTRSNDRCPKSARARSRHASRREWCLLMEAKRTSRGRRRWSPFDPGRVKTPKSISENFLRTPVSVYETPLHCTGRGANLY